MGTHKGDDPRQKVRKTELILTGIAMLALEKVSDEAFNYVLQHVAALFS